MKNILIIGAGRSSTSLIKYVLQLAKEKGCFVTVADADPKRASERVGDHPNGRSAWLDVLKSNDRKDLISRADIVVSLLPAHLHLEVAHDCIKLRKHLITASYVSQEMYRLGDEARDRELIFMGEMGLDPGIDHMSAKQKIEEIKEKGGKLTAFRSYTGGLIAPESDDNPWNYKFTWNPRNVVLMGQGTAQYLEGGKLRFLPYNRLFEAYRVVDVAGLGEYEVYANRDSLLYKDIYGLEGIPNILRGTFRPMGFCSAWNALIKIGITDGSYPILNSGDITYHEWMDGYVNNLPGSSVKEKVANLIGESLNSPVMRKLEWLGLFRKKKIRLPNATPALILEHLLLEKWQLSKGDKDMVVMQHEFEYELQGKKHLVESTLILKGENELDTAMSKLVGLPMGIFVRLVMDGKITSTGVNIPVMREVYEPVLEELKDFGVIFKERETIIG